MDLLIDTHAHICDPVFDSDRAQILDRAKTAGIDGIIAVGENIEDAQRNISLAAEYSMIYPAAGLYPTYLDFELAARMRDFIKTHREKLAAIGEVGLDHWMVKEEPGRDVQREIFQGFVRLSKELDLPLNVHSRSAGKHAVSILLELSASRVQMHAFDGKAGSALPAVEGGFFFSIPPSIVRSEQKRKLVRQLPLSCILVETDSPVLGPAPQERNEPANAIIAIKEIAEVKGVREESVREAVADNTRRLYRL